MGFSGDNGPATNAKLNQPVGIDLDTMGNIFFADTHNSRIRKIDAVTGIITTIAGIGSGSGCSGFSGDNGPATVAELCYAGSVCLDKFGNIFIGDLGNRRVRKINSSGIISTIAGNGLCCASGDGGSATNAKCAPTNSIVVDNIGNVYFGQSNYGNSVRKISTAGIISTVAGDTLSYVYNGDEISATAAELEPSFIAIDSNGLIIISDSYNNRIRKIDGFGIIHTIAGNGVAAHSGDNGPADSASIWQPSGLAFDRCGNLFIGEVGSTSYIRKVSFNPSCGPLKEQNISEERITIYPNPATEILNIDGAKGGEQWAVLNIIGNMEQKGILQTGTNNIPLKDLPPGIKLIEIIAPDGVKMVRRVVKE